MQKGYLALVFHAHLPYIRHPEYDDFLEENWFFEAITDCYIPIINAFDSLVGETIDFSATVSLSPTLLHMLTDRLLISRYIKKLDRLIELSELEIKRTAGDERINRLALMYNRKFRDAKWIFSGKYNGNLINAFKKFRDLGKLEIITCCATHGYLPLMNLYRKNVEAQVKVAVDTYNRFFGENPKGIWLPECGYHPGDDEVLAKYGIKYFFVENHGIIFGSPSPMYNVYSPYALKSGVKVFGRDRDSAKAVWSSVDGYPGDYNYREYYRDIGFDLDYNYVKPYINPCGTRINTGIKYYKITGKDNIKDIYNSDRAIYTASGHAMDFVMKRKNQIENLAKSMDRPPIVVAPYDAELFGHWWFEGPKWLDFVFRKIYFDQDTFKTITPSRYLSLYEEYPYIKPSMSSWGYKGYNDMWLQGSNDWAYRHLHKISSLMEETAKKYTKPSDIERRILNQMARELLLAESSDWTFMIAQGTFTAYASSRIKEHVASFLLFHRELETGDIDLGTLEEAESKYNIFNDINYRVYA